MKQILKRSITLQEIWRGYTGYVLRNETFLTCVLIAYKALNGTDPSYIREMLLPPKVKKEESRTRLEKYEDLILMLRPIDWREIFMKQSVGKCKQINFQNLCVNQAILKLMK